ncbi:MAG: cobaltochelatase subunit CobN [Spirochaetes bacterium]|nr:cobaltochelatase subunit CobN [Spirochaetota bacterium]
MRELIRITYFSATGSEISNLGIAYSESGKDSGIDMYARTRNQLFDESRINEFVEKALNSDFVYIGLHGGSESCPAFELFSQKIDEFKTKAKKLPYLHIQPTGGDPESLIVCEEYSTEYQSENWKTLFKYSNLGGAANLRNMLIYMKNVISEEKTDCQGPVEIVQQGIYHPDLDHVPEIEEYYSKFIDTDKPVVGIWFYQTYWLNNNLEHIDMLIREIEKQGAGVVAVFHNRYSDNITGSIGVDKIIDNYFMNGDKPRINVLLNAMTFSLNLVKPEYKGVLEKLGVPILQTMVGMNPYADWKESYQGVTMMDVIFSAAQPEFDGVLINVNTGTREEDMIEPLTGALIVKNRGIPDRIEMHVSQALNWARLSGKENKDKKVAIIFHHYPPRNDRIGCAAGLDSFASVKLLIDRMKEEGYVIDRTYDDGEHMSREILDRMTYDKRWMTPDLMAENAEAYADRPVYKLWHDDLPDPTRKKMTDDWGPMPGEQFVYNDRLNFAGTINGNIFITMQPPRGYLDQIDKIFHDMYLTPTHHYLAKYRWIKHVFKADAVIHVGKHGSLEWLPGKALGLSEECFPDLSIMDLPNIYPYIINDPGEGTQAKRRSYCCIIDHLTPAYTNSELYEDMAKLDNAIRDYQDAQRQDENKLPVMEGLVWDAAVEADIDKDLDITEEEARKDFPAFMEKMHAYLEDINDTMIADGLHTFGTYPEGNRLTEFAVQLTRLANGDVPSLRESVISSMGYDYDELLDKKGKIAPGFNRKSGGQLIDQGHANCVALVKYLEEHDFSGEHIKDSIVTVLGKPDGQVEQALRYITDKLVPNIKKSTEEITATLTALNGRYVEPGPTGAPSRGDADILPTGKNFYSVDPSKLPSPGAWEVGQRLANALIEKSRQEIDKDPEQVAIYITGTSTMKTKGDSIAEVLYLMGVRPVWKNGGVVKGVEIIPLEELGRPRYDLTVRFTGFFRDSFPNLMNLVDDAVKMVSALNEPPESNILRRNIYKDIDEYMKQGMSGEEAKQEAQFRIFSCPPGTYGAGVSELVESKNWESQEDLGNSYINWSSHAYDGKKVYGTQKPEAFRKVLSRVDATVHNSESKEYDMFSCTDYYNYYGGLIVAVKTVKGSYPMSTYGDSSDPKRVKVRTTEEEAKRIFRARLLNPKWINGLKRHGYKGAGDLSHMMDVVLGWDATAEVVDHYMYDRFSDKYALDPEMQEWMKEVNPYALQNILDKLLEAISRGMWETTQEREDALREAYLDIEGEIEEAVGNTTTVG